MPGSVCEYRYFRAEHVAVEQQQTLCKGAAFDYFESKGDVAEMKRLAQLLKEDMNSLDSYDEDEGVAPVICAGRAPGSRGSTTCTCLDLNLNPKSCQCSDCGNMILCSHGMHTVVGM